MFEDVVAVMNEVAAYDWKTFFTTRLQSLDPMPRWAESKRAAGNWSTEIR